MNIENAWYRISAKALIYNDDWKFLLCKERSGSWDLPWGWLDHGEDAHDCLRRELKEEMWLEVIDINPSPKVFVTAYKPQSSTRPWISNICYEVNVKNIDFTPSDECIEIWFFSAEEIKNIDVIPNVREVAEELLKL